MTVHETKSDSLSPTTDIISTDDGWGSSGGGSSSGGGRSEEHTSELQSQR